jgi:PEP-CTERM motif
MHLHRRIAVRALGIGLAASGLLAAPMPATAADLIGDTLTFTRTYPVVGVPWEVWDPVSRSTTVAGDDSDRIVWTISAAPETPFADIDPHAFGLTWALPRASTYIHDTGTFDGFQISGFSHDIAAVSLLSNDSGLQIDLSHTLREINLGFAGSNQSNGHFELAVTLVPEPGTGALWLGGLGALAAMRRCRSR